MNASNERTTNNIKPFERQSSLEKSLGSLFPKWLTGNLPFERNPLQNQSPDINVIQHKNGKEFTMQVNVAGYSKGDLQVHLSEQGQDQYLMISGQHREEQSETNEEVKYIHKNIATSSFDVSYPILSDFEIENCSLKNGLLNIHFKKNSSSPDEEQRLEKIPIQ